MSWDALNGIREGERQAKASARAKRRGAALARRAGSSKSKSGFSRAAGRAAVARGGRGIIIQKLKNGRGFKGLIDYATDPKKHPQFIFSNCGNDPQSALRTMCRAAALRPAVSSPVSHITLSLPPQTGKGEERWTEIVAELRNQLQIDESYPCIAVRHRDAEHDHCHLIYSRLSVAGQVYDEWGIKLKCAVAAENIEKKFGLKIFPRNSQNAKTNLSKNEVELGLRTGQLPARAEIASALKIAVQGKPTTAQFVERLNAAGVGVKVNVSPTTGKMSGFSFSFNGVAFAGSKISKEYGLKNLSEAIDYDQARDLEYLKTVNGNPGSASNNLANAVATIDQLHRAVATVPTTTPDIRTNSADHPPVIDRAGGLPNQAKRETAKTSAPANAETDAGTARGFSRKDVLASSLGEWVDSLHCRITVARLASNKKQRLTALLDSRDRAAAISIGDGYAVPNPKILTDEQIESLLNELGRDEQVQVRGTLEFCQKVEAIAVKNGHRVTHEFQVSKQEHEEFERRFEQQQREELSRKNVNSNLPGYRPGGL